MHNLEVILARTSDLLRSFVDAISTYLCTIIYIDNRGSPATRFVSGFSIHLKEKDEECRVRLCLCSLHRTLLGILRYAYLLRFRLETVCMNSAPRSDFTHRCCCTDF